MTHEHGARRVSTSDLQNREFWTPTQAARVLGRGPDYWRAAYDSGDVEGYDEAGAGGTRRYLNAASARAHLQVQSNKSMARIPRVDDGADRELVSSFLTQQGAAV